MAVAKKPNIQFPLFSPTDSLILLLIHMGIRSRRYSSRLRPYSYMYNTLPAELSLYIPTRKGQNRL